MLWAYYVVGYLVAFGNTFISWIWPSHVEETPVLHYFSRNLPNGTAIDKTNYTLVQPSLETKLLVQDVGNHNQDEWLLTVKDLYLAKNDLNVIIVEWSKKCNDEVWLTKNNPLRTCAEELARALIEMNAQTSLGISRLHIIGFSLGAHVGGHIASILNDVTGSRIARLSCLDAASRGFNELTKITPTTAQFVDAIHTSSAHGYSEPFATVDFFVNGGVEQPNCPYFQTPAIDDCSHGRSMYLWTESINSTAFIATNCNSNERYNLGECVNNSAAIMGENALPDISGVFFLNTNVSFPFALGETNITSRLAKDLKVNKTDGFGGLGKLLELL